MFWYSRYNVLQKSTLEEDSYGSNYIIKVTKFYANRQLNQ